MNRDLSVEVDILKQQMDEIKKAVSQMGREWNQSSHSTRSVEVKPTTESNHAETGSIFYSGHYQGEERGYRWEPQERSVDHLLHLDAEKASRILSALGHKQRLEILKSVMRNPLTGAELVQQLNMGTTGQLYHHIKELLGADLLVQDERGGRYSLPGHRTLPLLLLLAATSDLLDTSDYIDMTEARNNAGAFLGTDPLSYDPHLLLWALLENSILEHQAGYCSEISIFYHNDRCITVSDNGRGIPVRAITQSNKSHVQTLLTDLHRLSLSIPYVATGSEKGISVSVVNALSDKLIIEIRREGRIYRQDYKHGIPQTELITVGTTSETGTSITLQPNRELFNLGFDQLVLKQRIAEITNAYTKLNIHIY